MENPRNSLICVVRTVEHGNHVARTPKPKKAGVLRYTGFGTLMLCLASAFAKSFHLPRDSGKNTNPIKNHENQKITLNSSSQKEDGSHVMDYVQALSNYKSNCQEVNP